MAQYVWEDNTKAIYDKVISMAPRIFRKISERNLSKAISQKVENGGHITERVLLDCIKEVTPKPFLLMGINKIKELLNNQEMV